MERLRSLMSEPFVRFVMITLLGFVFLRIILAVLNNYLGLEAASWTLNLLSILAAGYGTYWLLYQRRH